MRLCLLTVALGPLAAGVPSAAAADEAPAARRSADRGVGGAIAHAVVEASVLTSALAVRSLTAEEAAERRPVRLRAQVTYYDPARTHVFVRDDTAGINVTASIWPPLALGDLVEIEGVSDPGHFAPRVDAAVVRHIGRHPLPAPRPVGIERLITGHEDSQWIEVTGIVRAVYPPQFYPGAGARLFIDMVSGGVRIPLQFPHEWTAPLPLHLADARVRIAGVGGALFGTSRQLVGVQLYVPAFEHVVVERPAPDPATLALQPIGRLFRYTTVGGFEHRIRAEGLVTAVFPDQFYVRDETGGVAAIPVGEVPDLSVGDRVELVGFPETGGDVPLLRDVVVLAARPEGPPSSSSTDPAEILRGGLDSQLVSVEATLMQDVRGPERRTLILEAQGLVFSAELPGDWTRRREMAPGSRLQVTGICSVIADAHDSPRAPRSFRLLLRDGDDIVVLRSPSWWTLPRTLWIAQGLAAAILAALAWVIILRRRVREQTAVIRERLEHEIALQTRYRDLFETANDVICTCTADGRVTSLNRAAERVTGYSRDEALQMQIADLVVDEHRARLQDMLNVTVTTGEGTTFEVDILAREGDRVTMEFDARRTTVGGGGHAGVQFIGRDITERKRTELALRRAKEAAETGSRAKTEFVANMSHELRTPLNGILGMTGLLLNTDLSEEQSLHLGMVKTSAESLMHVMSDILDFAKIEAGRLTLRREAFDLRESVTDVLQSLAHTAREAGLELSGRIAPGMPRVVDADPERVRQVLVNLIGNGLKFTNEGGVHVEVDGWQSDDRDGRSDWLITFRVSDTGIGVPADKHRVIFEAFTQVDGSLTRRYGGTGLGLTIASAVVRLMGGTIGLESEPGQGSTFSFAIPVTAHPAAPEETQLPRATTLIIDRHEPTREAARERLVALGLGPVAVASLDEAVALLRTIPPRECRIVLADSVTLGGQMSALVLALRELAPSAKLIGCALAARQEEIEEARRCGVVAFLPKPLRDGDLAGACQAALRERALTAPVTIGGRLPPVKAPRSGVVLLVEDNVINQRVAEQILLRRGHEVRIAHNGRQAVEILEHWTPDVVFMDVQMPEMNGIDATKAIRERERRVGGHVPIIALTAHAMAADRDLCLRAGMDDYLTKPVSPTALTQTVERIVEKRMSDNNTPGTTGAAQDQPTDQVLDPNLALERVDGDRELLGEIIELFFQDIGALVQDLEQAVRASDSEGIMRTAHRLKGSVATFAARPATEAALRLETMGRSGDVSGAADAFRDLQAQLARLEPALQSLRVAS